MQKLTLFFISALLLFGCSSSNEEVLTEQEVTTIMEKFDKGWKEKNSQLVDSVLSDKYLYFTQSGKTFTRQGLVETAGSSEYTLQNMERENVTIQLEGNTAVVNTIWKGEGFYHGEEFNDKQRCSVTIVKHAGKVSILAEHCTPIK
jgi:uncharacterized protein YcfL